MKIKVYLNDPADRFARFMEFDPASARLRLAAEFTLDVQVTPMCVLGLIYEQLNVGGDMVEATEWTKVYRANGNRSLSVGDVVVLGETAWSVDSLGFSTISTDDLKRAVA